MADAVVGSVAVDVVASAEDFWSDFEAKTRPGARKAGDDLGQSIGGPISDRVADSVSEGLGKAAPASKEQGSRQGASFADEFDKQMQTRIEAALKNLPDAVIGVDSTEADAKLAELRTTLFGLSNKNYLDVGLTDADAIATLGKLRAELDEVARQSPDIRVRVDAAAASVELAALQAQIDKINKGPGGPGGRGSGAGGAFGGLSSGAEGAGSSITELLLPAIALIAPTIAPAVASGVAGLGVLALGAKGLADNVTGSLGPAFNDLEKQATSALAPFSVSAIGDIESAMGKLEPLINSVAGVIGKDIDQGAALLNGAGIKTITSYIDEVLPPTNRLLIQGAEAVGLFLNSTRDQGAQTIGTLGNLLGIFNDIQKVSNAVPKVSGSAGGGKGLLESIGQIATGNEVGGLTHGSSIITDYISQGAGKIPGLVSDIPSIFENKQPKAPLPPAPRLNSQVLQQATGGLDASSTQILAVAKSYGVLVNAYQSASSAAAQNKAAIAANTLSMQLENNAAGLLSQALQGLGGDSLGVAQAQTQLKTGNLALGATLKGNKESLNENTTAGLANESALQAQVTAAQAVFAATAQQTGSTEQAKVAYDAALTSIENATGATGKQKAAIDGYIESIGKIPPVVMTQLDIDAQVAVTTTLLDTYNLGGVSLHDVVNGTGTAPAKKAHAAGGYLSEGWNTAGEGSATELMYKQGSSVRVLSHQQSLAAAMPAARPSSAPAQTINLVVDGKVLATVVTQQQAYDKFRR